MLGTDQPTLEDEIQMNTVTQTLLVFSRSLPLLQKRWMRNSTL
ncbi:MAG: hypothetical protein ACI8XO_001272 [Verrucomicrobiales bacterium]|jgi:hypothetical protein